MPAVGMELYGQIFQISSDPIKPYILWAFITMPVVWLLERKYIIYLFEILVYGLITYNLFSKNSSYLIYQKILFSPILIRNIIIYYSFLYFIYLFYKKVLKQDIKERVLFFSLFIIFILAKNYILDIFPILSISFGIFLFARKQNLFYTLNLIFGYTIFHLVIIYILI